MMKIRDYFLAGCLSILLGAGIAGAQESSRVQVLQRVVDGLNSASPVTRIATLEDAMATGDANIQNLALQTAFASSDPVLQKAAARAAFSTKKSFIVNIEIKPDYKPDGYALGKMAGKVEVYVDKFNPSTGEFQARSNFTALITEDGRTFYPTYPGHFSGSRVSFTVDMKRVRNTGKGICRGAASVKAGDPVLVGTMSCEFYSGSYDITIDLLN